MSGPWLLVSAWALAACDGGSQPTREWRPSDHGQPAGAAQAGAALPSAPAAGAEGGEARAARSLWNVSCASCHGADGRGGGPGLPPGARVPDLRSAAVQAARTDEALAKVIRAGQGMMPAFGKQLGEPGIRALVAHVRTLVQAPSQPAAAAAAPTGRADAGANRAPNRAPNPAPPTAKPTAKPAPNPAPPTAP